MFYLKIIFISLVSTESFATPLPESYPFQAGEKAETISVDQNLKPWLLLDGEKSLPTNESESEMVKLYLRLQQANVKQPIPEDILKDLEGLVKKSGAESSAMTSYFLLEALKNKSLSEAERQSFEAQLKQNPSNSCASKEFAERYIENRKHWAMSPKNLEFVGKILDLSQDRGSKKAILNTLAKRLTKSTFQQLEPVLHNHILDYPELFSEFLSAKDSVRPMQDDRRWLEVASYRARTRNCTRAKQALKAALKKSESISIDASFKVVESIGGCYRRTSNKARLEFWQSITGPLVDSFGYDAWVRAKFRVASLLWTAELSKDAAKILTEILKRSRQTKDENSIHKAAYLLGKILEEQNKVQLAKKEFRKVISHGSADEYYNLALKELVLMAAIEKDWKELISHAEHLIRVQDYLQINQREVSFLGFGLFWSARAHALTGNTEKAIELWQRLAAEFGSTYYGALGHFLLEEFKGTSFSLRPNYGTRFNEKNFFSPFVGPEKATVARIKTLLQAGNREAAKCELNEITFDKDQPEEIAAKILFSYAVGRWVDAIRELSNLPRSFRSTLPTGFERILFPKKFVNTVKKMAAKLEVDPDFALAVIRQESIFNEKAVSSAGAVGVMQLMPKTARLEAGRLSPGYVSKKEKRRLTYVAKRKRNLFDAETNITIGVHHLHGLLSTYDNPIFALSAYNASPSVLNKWIKRLSHEDLLLFVEQIPYNETRSYVKLILRNYFYYKKWYSPGKKDFTYLDFVRKSVVPK